jgi:5-(carboxyamino)imidazole ribonucleotide synthase
MGYRTIVVDPDPSAPAGVVADVHLVAAYDDPSALQRLILDCDVVTTEFENPPAEALDMLAESVRVAPSPAAVRIAQDRIAEKQFLTDNGFPVGAYAVLDDQVGLDSAAGDTALPASFAEHLSVIKTARLGYDGKGQRRVRGTAEIHAAWAELGGVPCVVEAMQNLDTELSVIIARTQHGDMAAWTVAENTHVNGILDLSIVPAAVSPNLIDRAEGLAMAIADALDYVGVLAVEMFVVDDDILINEIAPRPHNSGHWTLDGSVTSQYEQQIRAICDVGLGDTTMTSPGVAMINLFGDLWATGCGQVRDPDWSVVLADPRAKLHLYGKSEPRPGRKMGHITVLSDNTAEAAARAQTLRSALSRSL